MTLLPIAAFVLGAGVMAVEITASRVLSPYFGASLFVWTSLIVTVLLGMAAGYVVGGRLAEKDVGRDALGALLFAAGVALLAGMWIVRDVAIALSGVLAAWSQASAALFLGSLAMSFLLFALPVFLLAAGSPILVKEWSRDTDVGRAAGSYFAVSTIGSVAGTLAPTLVLVPRFGVKDTIVAAALAFAGTGILLLPRRTRLPLAAFIVVLAGLTIFRADRLPDGVIAEIESPYQLIRVVEEGSRRMLTFNEGAGFQSVYDPAPGPRRSGLYTDYVGVTPLLRPFQGGHRLLILGLAGGSVARQYDDFLPEDAKIEMVGVEVDPAVVAIAREHFALDATGAEVRVRDARIELLASSDSEKRYDAIVADTYSIQLYIPPHLATVEFFALAKSRLLPGGVFVMNVNASDRTSPLLRTLANSVARQFRHVAIMTIPGAWNHLVFASDEPFDWDTAASAMPDVDDDLRPVVRSAEPFVYDSAGMVFTDDHAPLEFMTDAMIMAAVTGG